MTIKTNPIITWGDYVSRLAQIKDLEARVAALEEARETFRHRAETWLGEQGYNDFESVMLVDGWLASGSEEQQ